MRHGETHWNLLGRRQGHHDSPLTSRGREQAYEAANALQQVGVDAIYTSPLGRAATTASIVAAVLELPVRTVDLAREIDHGAFSGLTNAEIEACYPGVLAQRAADKYTWTFPDGESYADASRRADRLVEVLVATPSKSPLVVTHEMFARMLVRGCLTRRRTASSRGTCRTESSSTSTCRHHRSSRLGTMVESPPYPNEPPNNATARVEDRRVDGASVDHLGPSCLLSPSLHVRRAAIAPVRRRGHCTRTSAPSDDLLSARHRSDRQFGRDRGDPASPARPHGDRQIAPSGCSRPRALTVRNARVAAIEPAVQDTRRRDQRKPVSGCQGCGGSVPRLRRRRRS